MSDAKTSKQQFRYAPPLRVDEHEPVAKLDASQRLVEFRQEMDLVPDEAHALRDWLNDVLPDETTCAGSGDPANCPENEGRGCCMPNPAAWYAPDDEDGPLEFHLGPTRPETSGGGWIPLYRLPLKTTSPRERDGVFDGYGEGHK